METEYDSRTDIYVEPDEVIPFASLCLNYWPYETGARIHEYIGHQRYATERGIVSDVLSIRNLNRVVCQPNGEPTYLLCLGNAKTMSLSEQIASAGNLFFLRRNILEFEESHKHYREVPPGEERRSNSSVCIESNLVSFVVRTIFEMNTGRKPTPEEEQEFSVPENRLWTWLGPIDPDMPTGRTFSPNDKERQEILEFVALAKLLRQMDSRDLTPAHKVDEKCLARMLKYRYPNLSKTEVYDFVFPNNNAADKKKDSQGTRWGITDEKRRKKKEPRS